MGKITLTQKTIDAITGYESILLDRNYFQYKEEETATFYQGDYIIGAEYYLYMKWIKDMESHSEMASDIPEDLSHWECYNVDINEVYAFDNDGNELEITNKQELYGKEN